MRIDILMGCKRLRRNGFDVCWNCGLVWIDQTGNKRPRLNRLDAWWTTLGGLWTGMDRSNREQTSTP
jgi:hypothetical protein